MILSQYKLQLEIMIKTVWCVESDLTEMLMTSFISDIKKLRKQGLPLSGYSLARRILMKFWDGIV